MEVSKASLEKLLENLHKLGQEMPACLISMTQVVQPRLQSDYRIPILVRSATSFLIPLSLLICHLNLPLPLPLAYTPFQADWISNAPRLDHSLFP